MASGEQPPARHSGTMAPLPGQERGAMTASRSRIVMVENPVRGGFIFWLARYYAFGLLAALGFAAMLGAVAYLVFAASLPRTPSLSRYQAQAASVTNVRAWDGTVLGEFAREYRELVPFDKFPPRLVRAFLAAEDRRYYEHGGIDLRGIVRAAFANLRAGGVAQGGSTITQQVAKSLLSSERTLTRKAREAILARRLEAANSKNDILTLYLNQIYLGNGAYGVAAAARRLFDKSLDELDLGEMAMLAGLANAPSRFSPITNPIEAQRRRDQVLGQMVEAGFATAAEVAPAKVGPVLVRPRPDPFREIAPYFAEHVRRDIAARYGEDKLWTGGLDVETTLVPWIDQEAQDNVDFSLRKLDKRQGYRGPVTRLLGPAAETFRARAAARYGDGPLEEGRLYLGLVETAPGGPVRVRVGASAYTLPPAGMNWAFPYSAKDATNAKPLAQVAGVLRQGDVVWVRAAHESHLERFADWTYMPDGEIAWRAPFAKRKPPPGPQTLVLEQTPRVQGAIFSYDHGTGYVLAMVGGHDFDRSEFNRVNQACRQPGSTYKPIYYSLALDRGYGYGSLLNDVPRAEVDPITGEIWTPHNLNDTVEYQVTLEYSLVWSKNVPSVQIFKLLGAREVEAWARRLGMTTPIIADQALALGASCTRLDELTRAFSAFARNGVLVDPVYVRRVRDRAGNLLEDRSALSDPAGYAHERLDRLVAELGRKPVEAIPARTAWLTSQLLRRVVTKGHAPAIRSAGLLAAGKTGTSSATMDTWFVGYTSKWMTTTWIGDDKRERPLGQKDAAFMLTVPMFARYMTRATEGQDLKDIPWERPAGVKPTDTGGTLRTTMKEVEAETPGRKPRPETDDEPPPREPSEPSEPLPM